MAEHRTAFEDLPHVGPATARRLRDHGIRTLDDLAAADPERLRLDLEVKGLSAARVREWVAAARGARSPEARPSEQPPEVTTQSAPPDGEAAGPRRESFVLTLTVDDAGTVVRSTATHVRTSAEAGWPGWAPDGVSALAAFVAEHAGLAGGVPAAAAEPSSAEAPLAGTLPPAAPPARVSARRPAGAVAARGRPDAEYRVDAGLVVVGPSAPMAYVLAYEGPPESERPAAPVRCRATLLLREVGTTDQRVAGHACGEGDSDLLLRFGQVGVPSGVYRASLDVNASPAPAGAPRARPLAEA